MGIDRTAPTIKAIEEVRGAREDFWLVVGAVSHRARWFVAEATAPGYQLLAFPSLWLLATGPGGISLLDGHRLSAYPCMVAEAVGHPLNGLPCTSSMCTIHTQMAQTQQVSVQGSLLLHRALACPTLEPSMLGIPVQLLNLLEGSLQKPPDVSWRS